MKTETPEQINSVLDDQLHRLKGRWPNDSASVTRWWSDGKPEPHWYAWTTSQGNGPNASTPEAAVEALLDRRASCLRGKRAELLAALEAVDAQLNPAQPKEDVT